MKRTNLSCRWLAGWLPGWLAGWLVSCLAGWLVSWLALNTAALCSQCRTHSALRCSQYRIHTDNYGKPGPRGHYNDYGTDKLDGCTYGEYSQKKSKDYEQGDAHTPFKKNKFYDSHGKNQGSTYGDYIHMPVRNPRTGWLGGWLAGWLAELRPGSLSRAWQAGWLGGWLDGWLAGWLRRFTTREVPDRFRGLCTTTYIGFQP